MRVLSVLDGFALSAGGSPAWDVRARMLVSVLASVATVAISNLEGQVLLVAASFAYALTLRRPVVLFWAYVLIIIMGLMAIGCAELMRYVLPTPMAQSMREAGYASLLIPFLRLLTMVHVVLPLALGSRMQNILDALRNLHLPFCLYLPAAVTLRFIPAFLHDVQQVRESLRLRGHEVSLRNSLRHPRLTLRLMCAPLLFRSLRASEDLGLAAELKGLGYGQRMTPYRQSQWGWRDTVLVVAAFTVLALAALCQYWLGASALGGMR